MNLVYLANPASPHVRQWIDLSPDGSDLTIYNIGEDISNRALEDVTVICPIPIFLRKAPKLFCYIYLGLWLRFFLPNDAIFIHAHNSSGYGFTALVSGIPYVLTTYGTEIFGSDKRGVIYWQMIAAVLRRALVITATTDAMRSFLIEKFNVTAEKIDMFSLGIAAEFENCAVNHRDRQIHSPIWFSNRRILPHYCIAEIVAAFIQFKQSGGRGELWLLQGDASGAYTTEVREAAKQHSAHIKFIEGMVSRQEMIGLLQKSHFAISIPISDQLSSSILEAMSQGSVPILRPLPAYSSVNGDSILVKEELGNINSMFEIFNETQKMSQHDWVLKSNICMNKIKNFYSYTEIRNKYIELLKISNNKAINSHCSI